MAKQKYLSIRAFCKAVGRSWPTVYKHIENGTIKLVEYPTTAKGIPLSEVDKYLKKYGKK